MQNFYRQSIGSSWGCSLHCSFALQEMSQSRHQTCHPRNQDRLQNPEEVMFLQDPRTRKGRTSKRDFCKKNDRNAKDKRNWNFDPNLQNFKTPI